MTEAAKLRHQAWRLRQLARSLDHSGLVAELESMAQDRERQAIDLEQVASGGRSYWLVAGGLGILVFCAVLLVAAPRTLGLGLATVALLTLAIVGPGFIKSRRGARGSRGEQSPIASSLPPRRRAF
jgi:hypothetical protein